MIELRKYIFLFLTSIIVSCNNDLPKDNSSNDNVNEQDSIDVIPEMAPDTLGERLRNAGLISIQSLDSSFHIDLKYASTDNFLGENIYGTLSEVYLQPEVAQMLVKAHRLLREKDSTLFFLVYDGVRPLWVQQKMWDLLDSIPVHERVKFVSNPKNGSLHNFGCAVDLTLCDANGKPLDMGAGYDDMRKIAYPELESHFLETGELSKEQYKNRLILRKVMREAGFSQLQTEWWHYNAMNRYVAKSRYEIVK